MGATSLWIVWTMTGDADANRGNSEIRETPFMMEFIMEIGGIQKMGRKRDCMKRCTGLKADRRAR